VGQDWPSPHQHESHPLPRVEDLPVAWEGYDRERVQAAFDEFYRHIAQLDTTLRALESVEVFRQQAGDLRAELRSMRSAGWSPYPRGYALTPERSLFGSVPDAVPRIALEVIFLVVVAAVVAVAKFSSLEIVAVMAGAVVITFLVELIAARDRPSTTPIPAAPSVRPAAPAPRAPAKPLVVAKKEPVPAAVEESTAADELPAPSRADLEEELPPVGEPSLALAQPDPAVEDEPPPADDGSGWAAFAEPAGPEPLTVMGALSEDEDPAPAAMPDEPPQPLQTANVQEAGASPEPEPEAEQEPDTELDPADVTEEETGMIARRGRLRRRKREVRPHEPPASAPKHVRVLPAPETTVAEAELPAWERGFDDTEERR
jgi:hypothetical protein